MHPTTLNADFKNRSVLLSAEIVLRLMRERGWGIEKLADHAQVSPGTISAILNEKHPTFWANAERIRMALQVERMETLLKSPESSNHSPAAHEAIHEWSVEQVLTSWITASNQLQFQICRLKHQHLRRLARGKRYELRAMSSEDQQRCRSLFTRHAEVCGAIGSHPHVIRNITTCESPQKDAWWVIDDWIDGVPLSDILRDSRLPRLSAFQLSRQIAEGLHALHQAGIVRRELSPQSILVCESGTHAVLSEFELAKLLDGSPTVSGDEWPTDPYRAPEASSSDVDLRADIYAWGRLTLHLLLGRLPADGQDAVALKKVGLDADLGKLLVKCVSVSRRLRPKGMDEVIAALPARKGDS